MFTVEEYEEYYYLALGIAYLGWWAFVWLLYFLWRIDKIPYKDTTPRGRYIEPATVILHCIAIGGLVLLMFLKMCNGD